jgi:transcription elongation factor GreB
MSDQPNYMTPEGYKRLKDEADQLWNVDRPRVVRERAAAAELGDRSENAEYLYAGKRLREIDRRLNFLNRRLENAVVVDPKTQKGDRVLFGATVDLENEDGATITYRIVGEDESDPAKGKLSWKSPLGRALLKRRAGDVVNFRRPAGDEVEYSVLDVRFE